MTENLPGAVRTGAEVTRADTDSWTQIMGPLVKLAETVATTEFVPAALRGKPAAVTAALLYGRETGLAPMTSLTMIHVVDGRPSMSAEGMRAVVLAAGHDIETLESNGGLCRMRGRRRGSETWTTVEWSADMARAAGLIGNPKKENWVKYPRAMLTARATAELCRLVFPDVIHGFRALEELDETEDTAPAPAPAQTGTKVRRARKATMAALEAAQTPGGGDPQAGRADGPTVPLPGESGYEALVPGTAPVVVESEGEADEAATGAATQDGDPESTADDALRGGADVAPDEPKGPGITPPDPAPDPASDEAPPAVVTRAQIRMLHATLNELGVNARDEKLSACGRIVGRVLESTNELTKDDASAVIDTMAKFETGLAFRAWLSTLEDPAS